MSERAQASLERRLREELASRPIAFTIMDAESGKFLRSGSCQFKDLALQAVNPGEVVLQEQHSTGKRMDVEALALGEQRIVDATPSPIDPHDVKLEARARIRRRFPVWRQLNIMREGGNPEMNAFIDAVRATSDKLEAMSPIPQDYKDDRWWPK